MSLCRKDGPKKSNGFMFDMDLVSRLKEFLENEARSCSMDFGCVTPLYVYRMWGGLVNLNEISIAMDEIKKNL